MPIFCVRCNAVEGLHILRSKGLDENPEDELARGGSRDALRMREVSITGCGQIVMIYAKTAFDRKIRGQNESEYP